MPILLYKPFSLSPLEVLSAYKQRFPERAEQTLCYAGRLDPMAEGLLIALAGDECKERTTYERMPKTYEFEVIPGLTTDTYDIMGLLTSAPKLDGKDRHVKITSLLTSLVGKQTQQYPPFSSARVNGKPLYYWSRKGLIGTVTIPSKEINVYSARYISSRTITTADFVKLVTERISTTRGEFRQKQIIDQWKSVFNKETSLIAYKCVVECSSGTYIRSIANSLGTALSVGAIALGIRRTAVGIYKIEDCLDVTGSGTVTSP